MNTTFIEPKTEMNINAKENGINNARFICGDAAKAALQLKKEKIKLILIRKCDSILW